MAHRVVVLITTLSLGLLVEGDSIGGRVRGEQRPLTATGQVYMVTSPDGLITAVTLDIGSLDHSPDGIVDHAFRLQHDKVWQAAYEGWATVTYTGTELRVAIDDESGWLYSLGGTTSADTQADPRYTTSVVFGLSHHWGATVQKPSDQVATALLATGCRMTLSEPGCDTCEAGGLGVDGCAVDCDGGSGCSANCVAGTFACCNCPGGCGCCKNISGRSRRSSDPRDRTLDAKVKTPGKGKRKGRRGRARELGPTVTRPL